MDQGLQQTAAAHILTPADSREHWVRALRPAAIDAYGTGEYVGQESFVSASEALALARAAGIRPEDRVLDLCCGTGGLAHHLAASTGCRILGVDRSLSAVCLAQRAVSVHAAPPGVGFVAAEATRLPFSGPFDAVLLFETMLAIAHKGALLAEVHRVLRPEGRFGLTLEEGLPLEKAERQALSSGQMVWLIPSAAFLRLVSLHGYRLVWLEDHTARHAKVAERLFAAYRQRRAEIAEQIGSDLCDRLIADHRVWMRWLATRRVRKLALVVERTARGSDNGRYVGRYISS